ncbi:hypothetical protein ACLB2K_026592 [Fragaria x ananassa]
MSNFEAAEVNSVENARSDKKENREEGEFTPVLSKKLKKQLKIMEKGEKSKGAHVKRGGNTPNATACRNFQQMVTSCSLLEVDTKDVFFTWTNRRTEVRLERALANLDWFQAWMSFDCRTLTKATSDHYPILVTCSRLPFVPRTNFWFQNMWLQHPGFIDMVNFFWENQSVFGCPIFVLAAKLKSLKVFLKLWNVISFGDINIRVRTAQEELDGLQQEISDLGLSEDLLRREDEAMVVFQNALSMQETFLRSKSRVRWLVEGDMNTSFLHNLVKIQRVHKSLVSIRVGQQRIYGRDQIASHVVQHFTNLFSKDANIVDTGLVQRIIPSLVTDEENECLIAKPTAQEIHRAVMSLDRSSAPGPDGFGGSFYQTCWSVVAEDVVATVTSFFDNGYILSHFNSNQVTLIPKKEEVDSISDFRPIALANFVFKIITRILADIHGLIASCIVSVNQSGFIKGRSITDPIILTSECVNLLDRSSSWGISNAFDTLDWNFLLRVLTTFGFDPIFVIWIKNVLHLAWPSVQVNGTSCGFFQCSKGVRQGDPLSPLLYFFAEEVLSRGLSRLVPKGKVTRIAALARVTLLSHVLFADDVMIFMQSSSRSLHALMNFMDEYARNSGQVVNKAKSSVFLGKYAQRRKVAIQNVLGIREASLPFIYLGVPIFQGCPKSVHLQAIADKVRCKLSFWKGAHSYVLNAPSVEFKTTFHVLGLSSLRLRAPKYTPVQWVSPPMNWFKVNTDGSFRDSSTTGYEGIFRNHDGLYLGAFSKKVDVAGVIDAEVLAVIEALKIAWAKRWTHIWLETSSSLVVHYFKNPLLTLWRLRMTWNNGLFISQQMQFKVSHIYRESNKVVDVLANYGALNTGYTWWEEILDFIARQYGKDLSATTVYRFG